MYNGSAWLDRRRVALTHTFDTLMSMLTTICDYRGGLNYDPVYEICDESNDAEPGYATWHTVGTMSEPMQYD